MPHVTSEDLTMNLWGTPVKLPAGTPLVRVKGPDADGKADLWAVRDVDRLMALTGNTHDPKYRYAYVPAQYVRKTI